MRNKFKEFLTDLLVRVEEKETETRIRETSDFHPDWQDDESVLSEEVPYKLEPDLLKAEKYVNRIRRQGW